MKNLTLLTIMFAGVLAAAPVTAQQKDMPVLKLSAVADVWVCASPGRRNTSMSRTQQLRLKGAEDMILLGFGNAELEGNMVSAGALYLHAVSPLPKGRVALCRVSTVATEWIEGRNSAIYQPDPVGGGASFSEAGSRGRPWAGSNSTLLDAVEGRSNTLHCRSEAEDTGDGWFKIPITVEVLRALTAGLSFGLCVMDGSDDGTGITVHSVESGAYAPYLTLEIQSSDAGPPDAPTDLSVRRLKDAGGSLTQRMEVSLTVPERAFAYSVELDGEPVPGRFVPFASPSGTVQTFIFEGVPVDQPITLSILVIGPDGASSPPVRAELVPPEPAAQP